MPAETCEPCLTHHLFASIKVLPSRIRFLGKNRVLMAPYRPHFPCLSEPRPHSLSLRPASKGSYLGIPPSAPMPQCRLVQPSASRCSQEGGRGGRGRSREPRFRSLWGSSSELLLKFQNCLLFISRKVAALDKAGMGSSVPLRSLL